MDVGFVDTHTTLEEGGCKVDRDVLKFGMVIPVFVEEKGEFLAISEGRDGHKASAASSDNVGDQRCY